MYKPMLIALLLAGCPAVKAPQVPATPQVPHAPAVPDVPKAQDIPDASDVTAPEVPVEAAAVEVEVKTGTVALLPFSAKEFTVAVGTRVEYGFSEHGSVGEQSSAWSTEDDVLPLVSEDAEYDNPKKMEAGMSGADAKSGTYVWVAKAPGEARISVQESFRGKVTKTYEFNVTVVAASD